MSIFGPFIAAATASRIGLGISTFAAFFIARRQAARATLVDGWVQAAWDMRAIWITSLCRALSALCLADMDNTPAPRYPCQGEKALTRSSFRNPCASFSEPQSPASILAYPRSRDRKSGV